MAEYAGTAYSRMPTSDMAQQSPLVLYGESTAIMSAAYLGSIDYYAFMASYSHKEIDTAQRFNKRFKSTHRTVIADTHGLLTLTVPIEKPAAAHARWSDIHVSAHGEWWKNHVEALRSAYGRTPFFEFYIDRFLPLLSAESAGMTITDFDRRLDTIIRDILGIGSVSYEISDGSYTVPSSHDMRGKELSMPVVPYYQVRSHKHGFIPHLSIVDLIFNMGPEAPLILHEMALRAYSEHATAL